MELLVCRYSTIKEDTLGTTLITCLKLPMTSLIFVSLVLASGVYFFSFQLWHQVYCEEWNFQWLRLFCHQALNLVSFTFQINQLCLLGFDLIAVAPPAFFSSLSNWFWSLDGFLASVFFQNFPISVEMLYYFWPFFQAEFRFVSFIIWFLSLYWSENLCFIIHFN